MGRVTGTIYLGGGGGAAHEEALWRAMLRDKTRVVYWPFALPRERVEEAANWLVGALKDLDLAAKVETWTDLRDHAVPELASAELLFVGGGNTFHLLDHVRSHGFLSAVRGFVADGGDYYGGSAGAILACADIGIAAGYDENDIGLTDLTALGLVSGFAVLPHFAEGQLAGAQAWSKERRKIVLGIPERSGSC
jgi:dipeptidase E